MGHVMRTNKSLEMLLLNFNESNTHKELSNICKWNTWGNIEHDVMREKLPLCCQDKIIYIFWILADLDICDDLYWNIVRFLEVKDVVSNGDPRDKNTWK